MVESTFNWYWLVDLLMENGYKVHLANPSAIQQHNGLKHSNDKNDSFWLAHLLRLGIPLAGYIYPKEWRPVRDLLRKRGHQVQLRTALSNGLQGIIRRNCGTRLSAQQIKRVESVFVRKAKLNKKYEGLQTMPGIGKILSLTIMLKTGSTARFAKGGRICTST